MAMDYKRFNRSLAHHRVSDLIADAEQEASDLIADGELIADGDLIVMAT